MGFFKDAFATLSMVMTGKVLFQIDTPANFGVSTMSLRIKQKKDGSPYVVLAGIASGNYQYYAMTAEEFDEFAEAVQTTRGELTSLKQ